MDGSRRPQPARARGDRLVQGLDRLPGRGRGPARQRRLRGEPDGARLRARVARRLDVGRPRRLRLRPGALLGRALCPQPRLPPEPGSRDPERRPAADPDRPARVGDGRGPPERPSPSARVRERRRDEQRRRRPADGARRPVRGAQRLVPRRRGLRRLRRPRRARPHAARRDRARRLDHARSPQVAVPTVRVRLPARAGRAPAQARVPDHARLPARSRGARPRGELLRPRPPADPHGAGVQGLGLGPVLRARCIPQGDRQDVRPRGAGAAADRGERPARARCATRARDRQLPPHVRRERGSAQRSPRGGARGERARARVLDATQGAVHDPHVRDEPHVGSGGRRSCARLPRADGRRRPRLGVRDIRAPSRRHAERGQAP